MNEPTLEPEPKRVLIRIVKAVKLHGKILFLIKTKLYLTNRC